MKKTNCSSWQRFTPRGLFWRVFIAIGTSLIVATAVTVLLFSIGSQKHFEETFSHSYDNISQLVQDAIENETVRELQHQLIDEKNAFLVLVHRGQFIGVKPPRWIKKHLRHELQERGQGEINEHLFFAYIQKSLVLDKQTYHIFLLPTPDVLKVIAKPLAIFAFFCVLLVASCWIAWMLAKPLREIQHAARQLATGDTSTRVPLAVSTRHDSIGDLGKDFNHMAARIQQLLDAQKQLMRDVSHELRTPLARMQVSLVIAQDTPAKTAAQLQRIEAEIQRLDTLINSILSITKYESGAYSLQESRVDLQHLLTELVESAEFEFSNKGIKIEINVPSMTLNADRPQLHRALENIIRNAMRYSSHNDIVEVTAEKTSTEVTLTIRDHGPGVEAAKLEKLFEPFFREEQARSAQEKGGHGVGLAIASGVVNLHGGRISACNAKDGGLAVSISLPLSRLKQ